MLDVTPLPPFGPAPSPPKLPPAKPELPPVPLAVPPGEPSRVVAPQPASVPAIRPTAHQPRTPEDRLGDHFQSGALASAIQCPSAVRTAVAAGPRLPS